MSRKLTILLTLILVAIPMLSACGGESPTATPVPPAAAPTDTAAPPAAAATDTPAAR